MKGNTPSVKRLFWASSILMHIWTIVIAYQSYGYFGALITLFLPGLSELYWMYTVVGGNDVYAYIAMIHLLLTIVVALIMPRKKIDRPPEKKIEKDSIN